MDDLRTQCPHARLVEGVTVAHSGVVCGVMEADAARADSILEGSPVGVFIELGSDPSTIINLCCGQGEPLLSPDDLPSRPYGMGHYTGCPIFAADRELSALERTYAYERPEGKPANVPGWNDESNVIYSEEDPIRALEEVIADGR